ncbi:DNA cytosine methyltransferase [Lacinutrix sp. Hel_I_90]|uniref:DNA cytosine methyltransferase n=1 Tax=Lacinutrix sp. Hel_I_90 TaxID=1249999 RepID=UPI0005C8160A|nr:DNA cytosine methyltransferase [Lacinutrix sp. Hel_I_90]
MQLAQGSIFSGIGGPDLAAHWMGWKNVFHCEWNKFGQRLLKYYWPNSKSYEDITKTDFSIHRGTIDVLTGGFPCQPFSVAGQQKGIDDDRYLWPEMLRAAVETESPWVICENVTGIFSMEGKQELPGEVFFRVDSRKLTRFDTSDHYEAIYTRQSKMLVGNIIKDLEENSYTVQTFVVPAAAAQAPHRRDRVWIVAHSDNYRKSRASRQNESQSQKERLQKWDEVQQSIQSDNLRELSSDTKSKRGPRLQSGKEKEHSEFGKSSIDGNVTNTTSTRGRKDNRKGEPGQYNQKSSSRNWENFPTQSPIYNGDDGISSKLDGITFSKWRKETIKGGGNAIVPQVIYEFFKSIESIELS